MTDLPLLVAPERLRDTLGDPALRVLDATVWLQLHPDGSEVTIESGRAAFEAGHIPGAGFADATRSPRCDLISGADAGSTTSATTRQTTPSAQPTAPTTTGSSRSNAATTPTTSSTSTTILP